MDLKVSYRFRACWFDDIEDATPDELGDLLGALRDYHFGREHKFTTRGAQFVFRNIKRAIEFDMKNDEKLTRARSEAGRKGAEARKRALEAQKDALSALDDSEEGEEPLDDLEGAEYPSSKQNGFCQNLPKSKSGKSKQALIKNKRTKDKDNSPPQAPSLSRGQKKLKSEKGGESISLSLNGSTHSGLAGGSASASTPPSLNAWKDHAEKIKWKADNLANTEAEICAAFFYWQKVGWRLKNGSPIVDWRAACADAKIRADAKAGRISDEIIESLIVADNAPTGWRIHVANRFKIDYDELKPIKWADYIKTAKRSDLVAIMRTCLLDDNNKHLLEVSNA